jgi:methionyl-tRNA synthetase
VATKSTSCGERYYQVRIISESNLLGLLAFKEIILFLTGFVTFSYRFHGIYWPAFLLAAGLEPPTQILCHSHWTVDSKKMSKSVGNVVDPFLLSQTYGTDGLRYFLLREGTPHSDASKFGPFKGHYHCSNGYVMVPGFEIYSNPNLFADFTEEKMRRLLNAELADTLGNLLSRCSGKAVNGSQIWPKWTPGSKTVLSETGLALKSSVENLPGKALYNTPAR